MRNCIFTRAGEKAASFVPLLTLLLKTASFVGLFTRISALCLCWGWGWCPVFTAVKLCRLTLCLLPTAGGCVAGLLGLLGAVLELLEALELFEVFGVVVVELPPDDIVELESDTGKLLAWRTIFKIIFFKCITWFVYFYLLVLFFLSLFMLFQVIFCILF